MSDYASCFTAVTRAGCIHEPVNASKSVIRSQKLACFRWVYIVLGNLKTDIAGTLKSIARRYMPRYLAKFQYRFNRRFELASLLPRLAALSSRSTPRPQKPLTLQYAAG